MRTYLQRLAATLAMVLVLAACGGADEGADGSGDDGANTPGTAERAQDNDATIVPTSIPDILGLSDECEGLANVMLGVIQAFGGALEGTDNLFAAGIDSLPGELGGDIAVLRRAVTEFAAAMDEMGVNPFTDPNAFAQMSPEQIAQFEQVTEVFDNDEVDQAFENIEEYGERECNEFNVGR